MTNTIINFFCWGFIAGYALGGLTVALAIWRKWRAVTKVLEGLL